MLSFFVRVIFHRHFGNLLGECYLLHFRNAGEVNKGLGDFTWWKQTMNQTGSISTVHPTYISSFQLR